MPNFEVERYEIYVQRYRIQAENEVDAIILVYRDKGDPIEGSLEFVQIGNDCGMPVSEALELATALWEIGAITTFDIIIPSIRSVREVE
jgi:hypothetical protein